MHNQSCYLLLPKLEFKKSRECFKTKSLICFNFDHFYLLGKLWQCVQHRHSFLWVKQSFIKNFSWQWLLYALCRFFFSIYNTKTALIKKEKDFVSPFVILPETLTCAILVKSQLKMKAVVTNINPFTAAACKISELKYTWMHLQTQYIFHSCDTSAYNAVRFDENRFTCQCKKRKQNCLKVSNFALLIVVFKWHHCSEGVKSPFVGNKNRLQQERIDCNSCK